MRTKGSLHPWVILGFMCQSMMLLPFVIELHEFGTQRENLTMDSDQNRCEYLLSSCS